MNYTWINAEINMELISEGLIVVSLRVYELLIIMTIKSKVARFGPLFLTYTGALNTLGNQAYGCGIFAARSATLATSTIGWCTLRFARQSSASRRCVRIVACITRAPRVCVFDTSFTPHRASFHADHVTNTHRARIDLIVFSTCLQRTCFHRAAGILSPRV